MNIHGADLPSGNKVDSSRQMTSNASRKNITSAQNTSAAEKAAFLLELDIDIPGATLKSIENELTKLGLSLKGLNRESVLRALTMSVNQLPLDSGLITGDIVHEEPLPLQLQSLINDIQDILNSGSLSREAIAVLETALSTLTTLISSAESPIQASLVSAQLIELWGSETEALLRAALSGETLENWPAAGDGIAQLKLDSLMSETLSATDSTPDNRSALINSFRELAQAFKSEVLELIASNSLNARSLESLRTDISTRLSQLLSTSSAQAEGQGLVVDLLPALTARVESGLNFLATRLALLLEEKTAGKAALGSADEFTSMKSIPSKNGMQFEWRMLAWYRAGRDPALLKMLMRQDMKGVLMDLSLQLKTLKKLHSKVKTFTKLIEQADTLTDNISRRQMFHLLNERDDRHHWLVDVPAGLANREAVTVSGDADKKKKGETSENGISRFSFSVETSRLGIVKSSFTVQGKSLGLSLTFENDIAKAASAEYAGEISSALQSRGFAISTVSISSETGREQHIENTESDQARGGKVDFSG